MKIPFHLDFQISKNRYREEVRGSIILHTLKIGSLNVRGCGVAEKMEEIGRMFVSRELEFTCS